MGHVKHEDVFKQYSEIGALFFPSLSEEPLPYAVIEAMLSGTLPVVSKVGGVPEIVQGTFAEKIMFTPADTAGSVDSLEAVLSLPEEDLVDIGVSLRENILQKFDSDTVRDELFAVFS
jgi:glycosyltransferase involved in cell wall biosynthesis